MSIWFGSQHAILSGVPDPKSGLIEMLSFMDLSRDSYIFGLLFQDLTQVWMQVLQALKASHATGIVHRDIKPQNVIISETDSRAKLIDMGAAADLRVGINYVPNEFLLDPRYAPPQQYIMSTQTPRAPPLPVAATLSPILWRLNNPDRFDMYSAGIMLLQMIFQPLRSDNSLVRPACPFKFPKLQGTYQGWYILQQRLHYQ